MTNETMDLRALLEKTTDQRLFARDDRLHRAMTDGAGD